MTVYQSILCRYALPLSMLTSLAYQPDERFGHKMPQGPNLALRAVRQRETRRAAPFGAAKGM